MEKSESKLAQKLIWIPMKTTTNIEVRLKSTLDEMDIEYFIPTIKKLSKHARQIKEVESPIIHNLIFIHTTWKRSLDFFRYNIHKVFFIRNRQKEKLTIGEVEMQQFINFVEKAKDETIISNDIVIGDYVRILSGPFVGLEGQLVKEGSKHYFYVMLGTICSAGIRVLKKDVKKIKEPPKEAV